jgi:hypothetical protein
MSRMYFSNNTDFVIQAERFVDDKSTNELTLQRTQLRPGDTKYFRGVNGIVYFTSKVTGRLRDFWSNQHRPDEVDIAQYHATDGLIKVLNHFAFSVTTNQGGMATRVAITFQQVLRYLMPLPTSLSLMMVADDGVDDDDCLGSSGRRL